MIFFCPFLRGLKNKIKRSPEVTSAASLLNRNHVQEKREFIPKDNEKSITTKINSNSYKKKKKNRTEHRLFHFDRESEGEGNHRDHYHLFIDTQYKTPQKTCQATFLRTCLPLQYLLMREEAVTGAAADEAIANNNNNKGHGGQQQQQGVREDCIHNARLTTLQSNTYMTFVVV